MTARSTYDASVVTALSTKVATNVNNTNTHQETIAANKQNVGYTTASGNFANLDSSTRTANAANFAARKLAEMTKQVAIQAAKDTLRATGDLAPL